MRIGKKRKKWEQSWDKKRRNDMRKLDESSVNETKDENRRDQMKNRRRKNETRWKAGDELS